ncbi:MAG: aldolase/citrate lyase family protein [Spirochaetes bacterium]|nr:aldolase/citrate lyase family protein [Spirochaetota bacterium]
MKLRRTMLYVPGNNAGMIKNAHVYGSDSIMFDLEDSITLAEKDSARMLVYHSLRTLEYSKTETLVRINSLDTPFGEEDIKAMVSARVNVIRLPKTETANDIHRTEEIIAREEKRLGINEGDTRLFAAIEGPLGVINAYSIATASKRLVGIALGAEDYVTAMKTKRSPEGTELLYARCQVLNAARAANLCAIDTVYSKVDDDEGFREEVKMIKQLGFDGKSVITPRQIGPVHEIFSPDKKEIQSALRIIAAMKEAEQNSSGVIALDGNMIDKPMIERAEYILNLAKLSSYRFNEEYYND